MLVLMLIFAVATHLGSPPFYIVKICQIFLNVKETPAKYPAKKLPNGRNYPEKKLPFSSLCYNFYIIRGTNPGIILTNLKLDEPATKAYGAASARFLWLFFRHSRKGKFWSLFSGLRRFWQQFSPVATFPKSPRGSWARMPLARGIVSV